MYAIIYYLIKEMIYTIIDNPERLEKYLADGGSTEMIPIGLDYFLNRHAEYVGIKATSSTPAQTLNYLQTILTAPEHVDDLLMQSVRDGSIYLLPYLLFRSDVSYAGKSIYGSVARDAALDALLCAGADIKKLMIEALVSRRQDMIDALVNRGYLETSIPTGEHYRRESEWPAYKATGRPMTYMSEMCKRVGPTLPTSDLKLVHIYLPVLRYQSLYHPESEKDKFCGTFYYVDAESPTLLDLGRTAVFGSKTHALFTLGAALTHLTDSKMSDTTAWWKEWSARIKKSDLYPFNETSEISRLVDAIMGWGFVLEKINETDNPTHKVFFDEFMAPYYFPILRNESEAKVISNLGTTVLYPTDKAKYWSRTNFGSGNHDMLDQATCRLARELGIDTVILQHEIGEYRVVSEILDTRADTYSHLFRVTGNKSWYTPSEKYPAVWFTDNGFITDKGITHNFKIDTSDMNVVKSV